MDSVKKQKMEELRKKLLQMDQQDFNELLDTSKDKPQWIIDRNNKLKYALLGNDNKKGKKAPHTEETKQKIKENNAKYWEGKKRPYVKEYLKGGKDHPSYGKGNMYIEYTTGFTGTAFDMSEKFNMGVGDIQYHSKKNSPCTRGKYKGLHFAVVSHENK